MSYSTQKIGYQNSAVNDVVPHHRLGVQNAKSTPLYVYSMTMYTLLDGSNLVAISLYSTA